jgi:hypothetical protein
MYCNLHKLLKKDGKLKVSMYILLIYLRQHPWLSEHTTGLDWEL